MMRHRPKTKFQSINICCVIHVFNIIENPLTLTEAITADKSDESEEAATETKKKKLKSKKVKPKKLVINISQTKYHVVKYVSSKLFSMKLVNYESQDENKEWDLYWCDTGVTVERLYKMKAYQRVNHFPGMYALARKDHLARNLKKMLQRFPDEYKLFPKTWLLPSEYGDFRKQFKQDTKGKAGRKTFISKPEASC